MLLTSCHVFHQDYFEDYQYLKPKNFESLVEMAQNRVACSYIESMLKQNVVGRSELLPMFFLLDDVRKEIMKCFYARQITHIDKLSY